MCWCAPKRILVYEIQYAFWNQGSCKTQTLSMISFRIGKSGGFGAYSLSGTAYMT